jgi:uncharacterized protein YwqG
VNTKALQNFIENNDELSDYKEYLKMLVLPCVDISILSDTPNKHESRFAGIPFVSKDFAWPSHNIGEYKFLGQINFSEIKNRPELLPASGLLSLFYAVDEEGEIFWGDDGYVLGYYWPNLDELSLYNTDEGSNPQARKIQLSGGIEIPRHMDLRNDWPFDMKILDDLPDLEGFVEDYMLGYPSYNTLAYDPTPGKEWMSLLTLSSCDELEWSWHDGDKLMIFIECEKLRNKDFSSLKTEAG